MGSMRTPLAALVGAVFAAGAWGGPGAWAQTIDPQKAQAWLEQNFGIKSELVVEATPDALVVLKTIEPRPPSDVRIVAHLESFAPPDPLTPASSDQEYFINCPSRRFHVERIESFSQNGGRGAQSTTFGPTGWGKPIPNSTEERVVAAACGRAAPVLAEQNTAPAPAAAPERKPPQAAAPAVRKSGPIPAPRSSTASSQTSPAGVRAQLFAGADREAAERFVKALAGRLPAIRTGAQPEIVAGVASGRPVYRVQVAGFASVADAARFCAAARAAGQDCFVPPRTN